MTISRNRKLFKWREPKRVEVRWVRSAWRSGPRFYVDIVSARVLK